MKQRSFLILLSIVGAARLLTLLASWLYLRVPEWFFWLPLSRWMIVVSQLFGLMALWWLFRSGTYRRRASSTLVLILSGLAIALGFYGLRNGVTDFEFPVWIGSLLFLVHYSVHFLKKGARDYIDVLKYMYVLIAAIGAPLALSGITLPEALSQWLLLLLVACCIGRAWKEEERQPGPELSEESGKIFREDERQEEF